MSAMCCGLCAMKPDAQRIAIAEACGWKRHTDVHSGKYSANDVWQTPDRRWSASCPDYLTDLNAMHEAENARITTAQLEEDYYFELKRNFRATAAQRAEAYLRTLGKWEES